MKKNLVKIFEELFEKNQIPFMEIKEGEADTLNIKVYFPKIIINICKFLDKKFFLKDKEKIKLIRDNQGYYKSELFLIYEKEEIKITIHSMLQNTWGIANKL